MDIKEKLLSLKNKYNQTLFNDFLPFWDKLSIDKEYGGYLCGFDMDGNLFFEDKSVWLQGRFLWMYSKLYNDFGKKQEWLDYAKCGYDFINKYCFAPDGHMYFKVTRDGKPLVLRRYYFSETFAIMGYCEYYKATGDEEVKTRAINLFNKTLTYYKTPNYFPPKVNPETRKVRGHSIVMIMLNVAQAMREIDNDPRYDELITECINTIVNYFIKKDEKALFETVGVNGERINRPDGRLINPGHSLETSWFLMKEAVHRKDKELMKTAIDVTKWSLEKGWDKEKDGIFYFIDIENKPVMSLEWDMKLFWPHCEALIALLYSYRFTKNEKFVDAFETITDYVYKYFPYKENTEWFGHLHRDGTPINFIGGSDWKSPFHNVRAFMIIVQQLSDILDNKELFND